VKGGNFKRREKEGTFKRKAQIIREKRSEKMKDESIL